MDNFADFHFYMRKPKYNLMILHPEDDEEDAQGVKKIIEKFGRYNNRRYQPKVGLLADIDEIGYADILNEAVRVSACIGLYLSDNFKVYNEEGNERRLDRWSQVLQNIVCGEMKQPIPRPSMPLYPLPKGRVDPGPFLRGYKHISLTDLISVENGVEQFSTEHINLLENKLADPEGRGKKQNYVLEKIARVIECGVDRWLRREEDSEQAEVERRGAQRGNNVFSETASEDRTVVQRDEAAIGIQNLLRDRTLVDENPAAEATAPLEEEISLQMSNLALGEGAVARMESRALGSDVQPNDDGDDWLLVDGPDTIHSIQPHHDQLVELERSGGTPETEPNQSLMPAEASPPQQGENGVRFLLEGYEIEHVGHASN